MDQKWIWILVVLVFCQNITSGDSKDVPVKEGELVKIDCEPKDKATMVVWLRVLDTSGMEFIASFTPYGLPKSSSSSFSSIFDRDNPSHSLTLKSFNKTRDSGVYSCASLIKGTELQFGPTIRLFVEEVVVPVKTPQAATTTNENLCTTATPCVCNNNMKPGTASPEMFCSPIILGPLAGGCGLLLLILIITTLYCNHIRTRRCPHHYKRKPRMDAPGKQMMNNRHV